MSVPEEETQELGVDAACGADDGGQEGDPMFVGVRALVLLNFLIVGGFYSEVALRNEKQRAQCILDTS